MHIFIMNTDCKIQCNSFYGFIWQIPMARFDMLNSSEGDNLQSTSGTSKLGNISQLPSRTSPNSYWQLSLSIPSAPSEAPWRHSLLSHPPTHYLAWSSTWEAGEIWLRVKYRLGKVTVYPLRFDRLCRELIKTGKHIATLCCYCGFSVCF